VTRIHIKGWPLLPWFRGRIPWTPRVAINKNPWSSSYVVYSAVWYGYDEPDFLVLQRGLPKLRLAGASPRFCRRFARLGAIR
jgi:hypothetical protein